MRTRLLTDELPSKQERLCLAFGVDHLDDTSNDDDEVAWGADPFDIVAQREALSLLGDD